MKLPEGIGFTREDFPSDHDPILHIERAVRIANEKLPALFEEWVKREGVRVYGFKGFKEIVWHPHSVGGDTHQAYLMLPTEIEK